MMAGRLQKIGERGKMFSQIKNICKQKINASEVDCLDCAFFVMIGSYSSVGSNPILKVLTREERNQIQERTFFEGIRRQPETIKCYVGQWTSAEKCTWENNTRPPEKICDCYFPFNDDCIGLEPDAIEKKQIRRIELENAQTAQKTLRAARRAIMVSLLAILISFCFGIYTILNDTKNIKAIPNNATEINEVNDSIQQNTKVLEEIRKEVKQKPATPLPTNKQ